MSLDNRSRGRNVDRLSALDDIFAVNYAIAPRLALTNTAGLSMQAR